jgi:penicillin-binding protein 2
MFLLDKEIEEVKKGMVETITSPLGTAHLMADLPLEIAGKTGSAQIEGNKSENAFFVGLAPKDNPQIAILILVEKARQGSLNAVPIAKDVLSWYYENRMKNK